MSHFSQIKTQLTDLNALKKALTDLQYSVIENTDVMAYGQQFQPVDLAAQIGASAYRIGFRRNPQTNCYDVVADWQMTRLKAETFLPKLMQRYAYHKIIQEVTARGLTVSEDQTLSDGTLKLVVRQWA